LEEVKKLKVSLIESQKNREELVSDLNTLSERLEDLEEENKVFRTQVSFT